VANGYVETVEALVSLNVEIDVKDAHGWTALTFATRNAHQGQQWLRCLDILLPHMVASLDETDSAGRTALHHGALANSVDAVMLLLQRGANPLVLDMHGTPPVSLSTAQSIRQLLEEAMVNKTTQQHDQWIARTSPNQTSDKFPE
jgi:ankyrin repeat protein